MSDFQREWFRKRPKRLISGIEHPRSLFLGTEKSYTLSVATNRRLSDFDRKLVPWSAIQRLKRPCGPEARISAIQAAIEQNSRAFRENFRKHGLAPSWTPTVLRASQQDQMKRDLTVSGFIFALVLVGVILAANTEQPVFWLLIGPAPVAILHTMRTFLRQVLRPASQRSGVVETDHDSRRAVRHL